MLDKKTYKFLIFLVNNNSITHEEYFDYHKKHKTNKWITIQMYIFLLNNGYIYVKDDKIYYSYQTNIIINYYKENKLSNIFTNYILPYIQQLFIFLIGLLTPYLLKTLQHILEILKFF